MPLAGMGQNYIRRHAYAGNEWFARQQGEILKKLEAAGIAIGKYDLNDAHTWITGDPPDSPSYPFQSSVAAGPADDISEGRESETKE